LVVAWKDDLIRTKDNKIFSRNLLLIVVIVVDLEKSRVNSDRKLCDDSNNCEYFLVLVFIMSIRTA